MKRLVGHLQRNAVAYVALTATVVLAPTSAYAVATIRSGDIVNGQVKTADLATDAVRAPKVLDESLTSSDVANNSLTGFDVFDNSITGTDITEDSLGQVPLALTALSGGTGRSGGNGDGSCDPESAVFITCTSISLTLPAPSRVLIIASAVGRRELDADSGRGSCRVGTSVTGPILSSSVEGRTGLDGLAYPSVMGVTPVLGAGPILVGLDCNQGSTGAIVYDHVRIAAVALSAN